MVPPRRDCTASRQPSRQSAASDRRVGNWACAAGGSGSNTARQPSSPAVDGSRRASSSRASAVPYSRTAMASAKAQACTSRWRAAAAARAAGGSMVLAMTPSRLLASVHSRSRSALRDTVPCTTASRTGASNTAARRSTRIDAAARSAAPPPAPAVAPARPSSGSGCSRMRKKRRRASRGRPSSRHKQPARHTMSATSAAGTGQVGGTSPCDMSRPRSSAGSTPSPTRSGPAYREKAAVEAVADASAATRSSSSGRHAR